MGRLVVGVSFGDKAADSLDPTISRSAMSGEIDRTVVMAAYEYDTGAKMRLSPSLAVAMPVFSKWNKLSYTVQLRQGIEFNDGTPFNAQAVVAPDVP